MVMDKSGCGYECQTDVFGIYEHAFAEPREPTATNICICFVGYGRDIGKQDKALHSFSRPPSSPPPPMAE